MTTLAIRHHRNPFGTLFAAPFAAVSTTFELLRACARMSSDYEQMRHWSDERLTQHGVDRETLPRHVFNRHNPL